MRATLRITWLLLSLSFLFYGVCSEDDSQNNPTVTVRNADTVTSTTPTTAANIPAGADSPTESKQTDDKVTETTTAAPTSSDAGAKNDPAQPSPPSQPAFVNTEATITTTPTVKQDNSQTQATTAQNNPTAPPNTDPPAVKDVTVPTAPANAQPDTGAPAAGTDGSHSSEPSTTAASGQIPTASGDSKVTEAPTSLPKDSVTVGETKTTVVPTNVPAVEQVSKTDIPITSTMSQVDKNQVTTKESKESPAMTSLKPTQPPQIPETTSSPSSQTQARVPAVQTMGPRAGTTPLQTTTTPTVITTTTSAITTPPQPKKFVYSIHSGQETIEKEKEKELTEVCKRLMPNWKNGTCTLKWRLHNGKVQFDGVEIHGKVPTSLADQYYEEITKKPTDNKTLIAILASCGALLIMIVILAVCASHHRKPYNENQQHLTEELHTVENGYHDNPTLEVMEVQPEMQEKKVALNGEFNDSWIVPIDNLLKEDIPDEEDTHL